MPPKRQTPAKSSGQDEAPVKQEGTQAEQSTAGASQDAPTTSTPTPSGTPVPTTSSRLASVTRPSSASSRGGKPIVAPKAPKFAGRRSAAARQEAEQAEAKKKAAEAAAAAEEAKRQAREARQFGYGRGRGRGVGRGGRGRGGHMGDSQRLREEVVPAGPFSSGRAVSDGYARRGGGGGGGGGGQPSGAFGGGYVSAASAGGVSGPRSSGGGGRSGASGGYSGGGGGSSGSTGVKLEPGMGDVNIGGMRPIKMEDGGYISSDEDETELAGPKQNVDRMQVIDLTGDDEPNIEDPFAPVRLTRVPHQDRTIGLTVEESGSADTSDAAVTKTSEKKKGKQRSRDVEVTGSTQRPKRPTAYSSSDSETEPQIKEEPTEDENQDRPLSPEPADAAGALAHDQPSSPESRRRAKNKIKEVVDGPGDDDFPMPEEPKFQTQAEKDEWDRRYFDLRQIRDELGLMASKPVDQQTVAQGDATMTEETPAQIRAKNQQYDRENGVYVFQFPPVLPNLAPVEVKPDPEAANPSGDAMDIDEQQSTDKDVAKTANGSSGKLPSGAVGKMRVHKSGKVTLDWGGTSLVVGLGADATFLQNVMIAQLPETKVTDDAAAAAANEQDAVGMGMGQIRGKFVVTPDWDEILK